MCNYDLIIGRDLMHEIGINILFKDSLIEWDGATIPMQPTDKLDTTMLMNSNRKSCLFTILSLLKQNGFRE